MYFSVNKILAVVQPQNKKIEAELKGGLAMVAQRADLVELTLVMNYQFGDKLLLAGSKVLVSGEAAFQAWAKKIYKTPNGVEFVQCPESILVGYEVKE